jgi:hypothetical protein
VVVVTGGHREEATDVVFDGARIQPIPGVRHPTAPRMARAARTRRHSPRTWRSAAIRSTRRGRRRRSPAMQCATASASSAMGGSGDVLGSAQNRPPAGWGHTRWSIIAAMKFLRMRPGSASS